MGSRRRGLRVWGGLVAALMLAAPVALLHAPAAQATTQGQIQVFVSTTSSGRAVPGAQVQLFSTATGSPFGAGKTTDAFGGVRFTGLSDGGYTALVRKPGFFDQYTRVVVIDDAQESSRQFMSLAARSDADTARARGTVTVDGVPASKSGFGRIYAGTATTEQIDNNAVESRGFGLNNDGSWALRLNPGGFKVYLCAHNPHEADLCGWVGPGGTKVDSADAAAVLVAKADSVTTVPTLALTGGVQVVTRLGGNVTGDGGVGLRDVTVLLFKATATNRYDYLTVTTTDSAGAYAFSGDVFDPEIGQPGPIAAGSYKLLFLDSRGEYAAEYFNDEPLPLTDDPATEDTDESVTVPAGADEVEIPESGAGSADATLAKAEPVAVTSGLVGRLTDDAGTPDEGFVDVFNEAENRVVGVPTFRDGTFAIPTTMLPPGTFKIRAYTDTTALGWLGGDTFKLAALVTVPVKGVTNVGAIKLLRYGSVSGRIAFTPAVAEDETGNVVLTLYDLDGESVGDTFVTGDTYALRDVRPGRYYVRAFGYRTSIFGGTLVPYIRQFHSGAYSMGAARPIVVKPGATTKSINFALTNKLAPVQRPSISGKPRVGRTLTARVGTWNVRTKIGYSYQWKHGSAIVGTSSTYQVKARDRGRTLTLVVRARDKRGDYVAGSARAGAVKVRR